MQPTTSALFQLWVDNQRRIVSFHPEDGFERLEFFSHDFFLRCVDEYSNKSYRYQ